MYPCYEVLLTNIIEVYAKNRVRHRSYNNTGSVHSDCLRTDACANSHADGYANVNAISNTYACPQPDACANSHSYSYTCARYYSERNRRPIASADYGGGACRDDRG